PSVLPPFLRSSFTHPPRPQVYTLSLHDALPISRLGLRLIFCNRWTTCTGPCQHHVDQRFFNRTYCRCAEPFCGHKPDGTPDGISCNEEGRQQTGSASAGSVI